MFVLTLDHVEIAEELNVVGKGCIGEKCVFVLAVMLLTLKLDGL